MARQTRERKYDVSDLRKLMEATAGWARDWDDVLRYLRSPREQRNGETYDVMPQLIEDIAHLRERDFRFTTDYRDLWKELTGKRVDHLPPPVNAARPNEQAEVRDDGDTEHTVSAGASTGGVERRSRVLDVLRRVESKEYKEMAELLESSGDIAWDSKR